MVAQQRNSYNSSNYVGCNLFILFRIHMLHKQQSYSIWHFFINARLCVHLFDDSSSNFAIDKKVINTERSLLNGVPFQTIINLEKQKYNE